MSRTLVEQLAHFTTTTRWQDLPPAVVHECKRMLLDSIGCALAGIDFQKGRAGRDFAQVLGGGSNQATVIGDARRASVPAAAFANAELINTLDMDVVCPPGHVTPAILASVMAVGEQLASPGTALIEALAIGHDIGNRFGRATDNLRDTQDGLSRPPTVFGYTSPIFGAAAAVGRLKGHAVETLANALGIAACISPVNSMMSWIQHAPATTIKYTLEGSLALQALTATSMAEFGHRGDLQVLDDREHGYARFIGTTRWAPEHLVDQLGSVWKFPGETSYKPYPHCRVFHALIDCVLKIVEAHDIRPHEIDGIKIFVEGFAEKPVWVNRIIDDVHDAQFSMYHGIAVAAHRVPPGKAWLQDDLIHSPSVLGLMERVTSELHPDYVKLLSGHAASRPARVEIRARGRTFVEEKRYPKGSPSPEADTTMTDEQLIAKFRHNAQEVLPGSAIDALIDTSMNLERMADFGRVMRWTSQ